MKETPKLVQPNQDFYPFVKIDTLPELRITTKDENISKKIVSVPYKFLTVDTNFQLVADLDDQEGLLGTKCPMGKVYLHKEFDGRKITYTKYPLMFGATFSGSIEDLYKAQRYDMEVFLGKRRYIINSSDDVDYARFINDPKLKLQDKETLGAYIPFVHLPCDLDKIRTIKCRFIEI